MRIGIVDIGSNTARLLVAERDRGRVRAVREERAVLALGDEVERYGRISAVKLAETGKRANTYARIARALGCTEVAVIVTAPGRQSANASELVEALERATGLAARVLSEEEEGTLAFVGAVAQARRATGRVAVCDVGGGSTEVAVGGPASGPDFVRSLDIGSLRLTSRWLATDPPRRKAIAKARAEVAERLDAIEVPAVEAALVTGGAARALRRVTGGRILAERELETAAKRVAQCTAGELASAYGLDPMRARTLLGGTLILAEAQRRLGVPLEVARGGLREGAAVMLLGATAAAA